MNFLSLLVRYNKEKALKAPDEEYYAQGVKEAINVSPWYEFTIFY